MHHWLRLSFDTDCMQDVLGYLASALVLRTFTVRSMRLLRWFGIASNLSFIAYAVIAGIPPILALHSLLLPMNIYRLIEIERSQRHSRLLDRTIYGSAQTFAQ
jgi:CRP/FNR family cyclic AMP-dependent transcriptional regulator